MMVYNLKTGNYSPFVALPLEISSIIDYLEASYDGLDMILSHLRLQEVDNSQEYKRLLHYFKTDTDRIIMLLLNSSRFCMDYNAFEFIEFDDEEFIVNFEKLFIGYNKNDVLIAISLLVYSVAKESFDYF